MKKFIFLILILSVFSVYAQYSSATLDNFRIENGHLNRVYFDSSEPLNGSNHLGFYITGNKISDIQINSGNTSGHFFVVSKPFTFWDNNTIRYEGGSDIKDKYSNDLRVFDLQFIENNIIEPAIKGESYYVSTSGNDGNSGLKEGSSWRTISYAATRVKSGDVVYIKAGEYKDEKITVSKSGTSTRPIKFIGYRSSVNEDLRQKRSVGMDFDPKVMPLILEGSISSKSNDYLIFRNLQIYSTSSSGTLLNLTGSNYSIADNVYTNGGAEAIKNFDYHVSNTRVINSYVANASSAGVRLGNEFNLVDNTWAVSSKVDADMDYYINIYGGVGGEGNIIRNCYVDRDLDKGHSGHGISLKAGFHKIENSLVEKCQIFDIGLALEARHSRIRNNVYRDIYISKNGNEYSSHTGIQITSSQNCVFDRIHVENYSCGIKFLGSTEDSKAKDAGNGNIIKNSLFTNMNYGIWVLEDLDGKNRVPRNNSIINCTFDNMSGMFLPQSNDLGSGNKIINSIISNVKNEKLTYSYPIDFDFSYTNFYSSDGRDWSSRKQPGTSNFNVDPKYKDAPNGNYRLESNSSLKDAGKDFPEIDLDFDSNPRSQGDGTDIGAFEYQDKTTSSVKVDAGEDQQICLGEEVTLTASGGKTYLWSNGSTESSIQVSPEETTTYSVEVSDSGRKATDEVTVTVSNIEADAGEDVEIKEGEEVTLTASGGDKYEWSTGEKSESISVSPGSTKIYSVTVFKDGCLDTDDVIVKVVTVSQVVADAGNDVTINEGESVTLTASGGSTYKWSNGATSKSIKVSPGSTTEYTVTVSIGAISDTDNVIVTVIQRQVEADAGNDVTINKGESVTLTASGGSSYKWSNGATSKSIKVSPSTTTRYTVTVSEGNVSDKDDVLVTVIPTIVSTPVVTSADAGDDVSICLGDQVTLTGSGGSDFEWSTGSKSKSIEVNPVRTTTYTLYVTTNGQTTSDTVVVSVENCDISAAPEDELEIEFKIYPNPSSEILNINMSASDHELNLSMISTTGSIMYANRIISKSTGTTELIDVSRFESGVYFVRLSSPSESVVKKVIII